MQLLEAYGLRIRRRRLLWRAFRARRQLQPVADRTGTIRAGAILLVAAFRNEAPRLPHFLRHYRGMGVDHFLLVDNGSDDGAAELLRDAPDVSLWRTGASYRQARFGMDWLGWLLMRHGHGHWTLTVDLDEFLVYPFCDSRPLRALTDWLDAGGMRALPAMLLDMYPKGPVGAAGDAVADEDPFRRACWFDSGNYMISKHPRFGNLWIQGGARARCFFADDPARAPALNKIPLVRWNRRFAFGGSTHYLLPRGLNRVYDEEGGERISGVLLHDKFGPAFPAKAAEEMARGEHYAGSAEYRAYRRHAEAGTDLWCPWSERYLNWRQLELLGLISKGAWA